MHPTTQRIEIYEFEKEIAAGESWISKAFDLNYKVGYFSLQMEISGDGNVDVSVLCSNNESDYIEFDEIASAQDKTSGAGSDGKTFHTFKPGACASMKLKFEEKSSSDAVTVKGWLAMQ